MATACPSCGQRNRDKVLRCARCGAPLGAEPTAAAMPAAPESGVPDWRADAADDPRAGDGRARDRRAASGTGMAWLPWAIAGIAAAVAGYVVLNRPAPAPSAGEGRLLRSLRRRLRLRRRRLPPCRLLRQSSRRRPRSRRRPPRARLTAPWRLRALETCAANQRPRHAPRLPRGGRPRAKKRRRFRPRRHPATPWRLPTRLG